VGLGQLNRLNISLPSSPSDYKAQPNQHDFRAIATVTAVAKTKGQLENMTFLVLWTTTKADFDQGH
jgi:hypothetical protein